MTRCTRRFGAVARWAGLVSCIAASVVQAQAQAQAPVQGADGGRVRLEAPMPRAAQSTGGTSTPYTDARGGDHMTRDAERRAREAGGPAGAMPRAPGESTAPRPLDPGEADALRQRGAIERDARRLRGGMAPPPEATPRIDIGPQPGTARPAPPPRVDPPRAGEPGGAPIALPTCGPNGCFDANGRLLPSAGGDVLVGPGGRPCVRIGSMAAC